MKVAICWFIFRAASGDWRKSGLPWESHVVVVALNPNYTFDPDVFPEIARSAGGGLEADYSARTEKSRGGGEDCVWTGLVTASTGRPCRKWWAARNRTAAFALPIWNAEDPGKIGVGRHAGAGGMSAARGKLSGQ